MKRHFFNHQLLRRNAIKGCCRNKISINLFVFLEGLIGVWYFELEKKWKYYHRILQNLDFHQVIFVFRGVERRQILWTRELKILYFDNLESKSQVFERLSWNWVLADLANHLQAHLTLIESREVVLESHFCGFFLNACAMILARRIMNNMPILLAIAAIFHILLPKRNQYQIATGFGWLLELGNQDLMQPTSDLQTPKSTVDMENAWSSDT